MDNSRKRIEELTTEREIELKDFVDKNSRSQIQHSLEFSHMIKETYKNCKRKYYILIKNNSVVALFPFFTVKSRLFGNRMISVPFLDVGGFLGEYEEGDVEELISTIRNEKDKVGNLKFIEIRMNELMENFEKDRKKLLDIGFSEDSSKKQIILDITNQDDTWKKFHKHTRNEIRKAEKSGLILKKIDNKDEIKRFYKVYFDEMKNFGTPCHSLKFFTNIFSVMNKKAIGFNCYHEKNLIASIILFHESERAYIAFNVSNPKYRNFKPNDLLYWEAIKWSIKSGIRYLDFGQIEITDDKNSRAYGLYKFKSKWLGKIYQRSYFYFSTAKKEDTFKEKKEGYKKFRKTWSKLPGFIIRYLGPKICSQLGV